MILTLIGMSGAGKTFWATRLAEHGFTCFHCDDLLAEKLHSPGGPVGSSAVDIGRWMGLPHEPGFQQREAVFLEYEAVVIREVVERAAICADNGINCVIDTGGSAIYAGGEIFRQIRSFATIIYLTIPAAVHHEMLMTYLAHPLPLIWNGIFSQQSSESLDEAFARCYSQLIWHREQLYDLYSDVKLAYSYYRQPALTADRFLHHIQTVAC